MSCLIGRMVGSLLLLMPMAFNGAAEPSHAISVFGDFKYKAGFAHFDYVNPDAPKGGRLVTMGTGALSTFDSFNNHILKGDRAQGLELVYDSLMVRAQDEPGALYGLIAQTADLASDRRSIIFKLRPEAKFSDGTPVTADDCVFTFEALKEKGHPDYSFALRNVSAAVALDAHTVRYTFGAQDLRDLPSIVAALPVLPKAFYDKHPFGETWLVPPVGSGPYSVGAFKPGTFVSFVRLPDYWARDLNVNHGRYNFDEVRIEYFRDRTISLEALKAKTLDLREEFTAKEWATGYEIPPVKDGRMILKTLPDNNPSGTQGFWINSRKDKFADPRVRHALDLAFDYEWANKNLFYSQYKRTVSYFENSQMKAVGLPSAAELALLEPFKEKLPAAVFKEPYEPPISDGSGQDRRWLAEAAQLLGAAGFLVKDGRRMTAAGVPFDIEFMITDPSSERFLGEYVRALDRLGIAVTQRRVDDAQYERRVKSFDFDIVGGRFTMQLTPGLELKTFFGSDAARTEGSRNLAGIRDPVVDALIDRVIEAKNRAELEAAARALDRVLRAGHHWVSHWFYPAHRLAFWDKFGWPRTQPQYTIGLVDTWWYDAQKAAKLVVN